MRPPNEVRKAPDDAENGVLHTTNGPTPESDEQLAALLSDIAQRLQRGERIEMGEWADRFPQYAEQFARFLPAMQSLANLRSATPGTGTGGEMEGSVADFLPNRLGDYHIRREVGRGGMGIVYEAEQISLRRRVALKVLPYAAIVDPRQLARFQNEAHAAASLRHQNIVPVFAVGCERGVHYYAMQYVDGQSLAQVVHYLRSREHHVGHEPGMWSQKWTEQRPSHSVPRPTTMRIAEAVQANRSRRTGGRGRARHDPRRPSGDRSFQQ